MLFPSPGWYKRFSIQALMFVLLAAGSPVCVSAEAVRLGVLSPRPDVAETKRQWESIRSELEESLDGRDLVVEVFSLQGLERAVASRRVDFVLTSPGHYEMLLSRYGLSAPLATRVTRYEGQEVLDVIGGVMIVRNDNEAIQNL